MPEVKIERLGHLGDGIAEGPIFVPRALPDEIVEGDVDDGTIKSPRIISPSTSRVAPPCRHYKMCGGCGLQHASEAFVAAWKQGVVARALSAVGLSAPLRRLHTSPPNSRRRATLSGRRTKKGALVGFHAPKSDAITEVSGCQVLKPSILAAMPAFAELTRIGASRTSEIRIFVAETESGLDVQVDKGKPADRELQQALVEIASKADLARLTWDAEVLVERRKPIVRFGSAPVPIPPGAFLQATEEGEAALLTSVTDAVSGAKYLADLFSGCGTFSLPIALQAEIDAYESDASLLDALDLGWRHADRVKRVSANRRDLFRQPLLPDELSRFQAVIIDPPRAGAEAQMREIAQAKVPRVASVSCNPTTFARDAAILVKNGYTLEWIDVVDQFRWSPHVEIAALFTLP